MSTPKKPYQSPNITSYGDILEITRAVGLTGNPDGGPAGMTKTSP